MNDTSRCYGSYPNAKRCSAFGWPGRISCVPATSPGRTISRYWSWCAISCWRPSNATREGEMMKRDEHTPVQMILRLMTVATLLAKGTQEPKPPPSRTADRPAKNTERRSWCNVRLETV